MLGCDISHYRLDRGHSRLAVEAAKIVFFLAIVLLAISAIAGFMRGRRTAP